MQPSMPNEKGPSPRWAPMALKSARSLLAVD